MRLPARLVGGVTAADGVAVAIPVPEGTRVISENTARQVREMLEQVVVVGGTAPMAGIPGYRIGGKTGTAQVINPECGCYEDATVGSFIGMAPIESPELVIGVTFVRPTLQQFGGELAGPVFREIMAYALQARQVAPITGPQTTSAQAAIALRNDNDSD